MLSYAAFDSYLYKEPLCTGLGYKSMLLGALNWIYHTSQTLKCCIQYTSGTNLGTQSRLRTTIWENAVGCPLRSGVSVPEALAYGSTGIAVILAWEREIYLTVWEEGGSGGGKRKKV